LQQIQPVQQPPSLSHAFSQSASSSTSSGHGHVSAIRRVKEVADDLARRFQSAAHDAGIYPGPLERIFEQIANDDEFQAAIGSQGAAATAAPAARWAAEDLERYFTVQAQSNFYGGRRRAALSLPPYLAELRDLLEQVNLYFYSLSAKPLDTLHDVSTDLPHFLASEAMPCEHVDATGQRREKQSRFNYRDWPTFRRWSDLRIGPITQHPLAKHYFRIPHDLVHVPTITKKGQCALTAEGDHVIDAFATI